MMLVRRAPFCVNLAIMLIAKQNFPCVFGITLLEVIKVCCLTKTTPQLLVDPCSTVWSSINVPESVLQ